MSETQRISFTLNHPCQGLPCKKWRNSSRENLWSCHCELLCPSHIYCTYDATYSDN